MKLQDIKKEEQRHLRAAKKVPKSYQHKYEMDRRSEEYVQQAQEAVSNAVDDLHSVESSSERDESAEAG